MLTQFFILGAGAMVVIGPSLGYWGQGLMNSVLRLFVSYL